MQRLLETAPVKQIGERVLKSHVLQLGPLLFTLP
jgi:hypothetical protein